MNTIDYNTMLSYAVGAACLLFWLAILISWIWTDAPKKESKFRPGEYINSEIEDEDKN